MCRTRRSALALALACMLIAIPVQASQTPQPPPRPSPDPVRREAAEVAAVWTLIAEGQIDRAEQRAQQVLASRPRSAAALAAAVAAAGAKGGSAAALGVYDRWIGSRTLEEPLVLRSLALVLLREEAKQDEDPVARGEALRALAREGERTTTGPADPAVSQMIADLQATPSSAQGMKFLEGLGAAGTPAALDALLSRADDERMEIRGAVASALANFPDDKARAQLNRLLGDRTAWVRARAAGALLKLGDQSGIGVLQTLAADTLPSMRLLAADELAARPDAAWQTLVRDLASSTDPAVSASAAGLLASFDPARAREVLDTLQKSENPAIQELARIKAGEATIETGTLTDLRLVLHAQEHIRRTRAAARILDLTR